MARGFAAPGCTCCHRLLGAVRDVCACWVCVCASSAWLCAGWLRGRFRQGRQPTNHTPAKPVGHRCPNRHHRCEARRPTGCLCRCSQHSSCSTTSGSLGVGARAHYCRTCWLGVALGVVWCASCIVVAWTFTSQGAACPPCLPCPVPTSPTRYCTPRSTVCSTRPPSRSYLSS